jgi:hypothetical protein
LSTKKFSLSLALFSLSLGRRRQVREAALSKSQVGLVAASSDDDGDVFAFSADGQRVLKPLKAYPPNSGRLLFDDQRWTFIPNGHSLKGPAKEEKKRESKAAALAAKLKAKKAAGKAQDGAGS